MLIEFDPDDYEVVSTGETCAWHKRNPGKPYAGCTCSSSIGMRRRDPFAPEKVDRESLGLIKRIGGGESDG